MSIPKMPTFKQPDKHKTKAVIQREIRQLIVKLRNILPKSNHGEELIRFLGVIYPGERKDTTRLPMRSKDGVAKENDRVLCLYAMVSRLVETYWDYCLNDDAKVSPTKEIMHELEAIATYGLGHYRVIGGPKEGYRLELLKRGEK